MSDVPVIIVDGGGVPATRRVLARRRACPQAWSLAGAVLVLLTVAGCMVQVTVPVLWPVGASLAAIASAVWGIRCRLRQPPIVRTASRAATGPARTPTGEPAFTAGRPRAVYNPGAPTGAPHGERTRIGDAERDLVLGALREHAACGRLTMQEFEDRCALVLDARTLPDLTLAVVDLPELPAAEWSQ